MAGLVRPTYTAKGTISRARGDHGLRLLRQSEFAGFSLKRPRKCLLSSFIGEPSVRGRIDKGAKS